MQSTILLISILRQVTAYISHNAIAYRTFQHSKDRAQGEDTVRVFTPGRCSQSGTSAIYEQSIHKRDIHRSDLVSQITPLCQTNLGYRVTHTVRPRCLRPHK